MKFGAWMMSEADLDELLQMVRNEIELDLTIESREHAMALESPPIAANDNSGEWPLLPFPDGWIASC